jgi:hypothetical protein
VKFSEVRQPALTFKDGGAVVTRAVTITGPRTIGPEPHARLPQLFDAYLRPFADPDAVFYLGGAIGVDTVALNWLAEYTRALLVVVVPRMVIDQPAMAAEAIQRWKGLGRLTNVVELRASKLDTDAYHARNRWMVDHSGLVIGFPHGKESTSGTWYTLSYAADQGKPHLVVPL